MTLVIARGLLIPFIKYTYLYNSFGLFVLLQVVLCYPIEFVVKKLPLRYRRVLWPYLEETLTILLRPFAFGLDLVTFVAKLVLFGQFHQIRARLL